MAGKCAGIAINLITRAWLDDKVVRRVDRCLPTYDNPVLNEGTWDRKQIISLSRFRQITSNNFFNGDTTNVVSHLCSRDLVIALLPLLAGEL